MRDNRSSQEQLVDPLGPSGTRKVPHTSSKRGASSRGHTPHGHPPSKDGSYGTSARSSHRSEDGPPRHGTDIGPRAAGGQEGTLGGEVCRPPGARPGRRRVPRTLPGHNAEISLGGDSGEGKKGEKPSPKPPTTGYTGRTNRLQGHSPRAAGFGSSKECWSTGRGSPGTARATESGGGGGVHPPTRSRASSHAHTHTHTAGTNSSKRTTRDSCRLSPHSRLAART